MAVETNQRKLDRIDLSQQSPFSRIPCGTSLQVERSGAGRPRKGSSHVIGSQPGKYLFFELPFEKNAPLISSSFSGNVIIRFFLEGNVYGFESRVRAVDFHPFPFVICDYPKIVQQFAVRSHKRLECSFPVRMFLDPPGPNQKTPSLELEDEKLAAAPLKGNLADLAIGGCRIVFPLLKSEDADASQTPEALKGNHVQDTIKEPEEKEEIEADKTHLYAPESLEQRCFSDRKVRLDIDIPYPPESNCESINAEIRWAGCENCNFSVGLQFLKLPSECAESIYRLENYVEKYFSSCMAGGA